jgi:CheY-like chemotaxis protein
MSEQSSGVLLSDDLLFASKITSTARALRLSLRQARSSNELLSQIEAPDAPPRCVILDLHHPGLDIETIMQRLKQGSLFVVGYGSHVDASTLKRARDAGCDLVLPRSKFVEELPTALPRWLAGRP